MMRIGVISDTHLRHEGESLPKKVFDDFRQVDLILHAGDINHVSVLTALNTLAEVEAVYGNTDPYETYRSLAQSKILNCAGYRVGLTHGNGHRQPKDNARHMFKGQPLDIIVFGHSHCPFYEVIGNTVMFNPGSPVRPRCTEKGTVGILELGETIEGRIIEI